MLKLVLRRRNGEERGLRVTARKEHDEGQVVYTFLYDWRDAEGRRSEVLDFGST